jgi:hypothetical protein
VPEYDAFGREIGEDPLAALREATASVKPAPVAEPVEAAPAAEVAEPEPAPVADPPRFVRPARRVGAVARVGIVVGLLGLLFAIGNAAVEKVGDGLEGLVETEDPSGLERESMLRTPNVAAALLVLRNSGLGRPLTLRVYPDRVDARLVAGNGRQSLVSVTAQRELRTLETREGGRARGIPYGRIEPAMPERLVRAGDGRTIRFVRLDRTGWRAYFRDAD